MQAAEIGNNIRKYRKMKNLRQEDLAELASLSVTYIGMVERGEKTLSMDAFVRIVNALDVSSDMILGDVLNIRYEVKHSVLDDKLNGLSDADREMVYDLIETLLKHCK